MGDSNREDLVLSINELKATLADAPEQMRPIVEQQIRNLESTLALLDKHQPAIDHQRANRRPVDSAVQAYFVYDQLPAIAQSIPNGVRRDQVTEAMMSCPAGAQVYWLEHAIECAVQGAEGTIPKRHGLSVGFYESGSQQYQRMYDRGCLRWAIDYYANGHCETWSYYSDVASGQHRPHGLFTRFAPNGVIIAQSWYWDGVHHGWSRLWEDDGYPIVATYYNNGTITQEVRVSS